MDNLNSQPSERRKYIRVFFSQDISCDTVLNPNTQEATKLQKPLSFTTTNISLGGISILSDIYIEESSILYFKIDIDSIWYDIAIKVIYCASGKDTYFIGGEFVSPTNNLIDHIKRLVTRLSFGSLFK